MILESDKFIWFFFFLEYSKIFLYIFASMIKEDKIIQISIIIFRNWERKDKKT